MSEVVLTWRHLVQLCCEDEDQAGCWSDITGIRCTAMIVVGYYGSNGICLKLPQTIEIVVDFRKGAHQWEKSRNLHGPCQWPFPLALASSLHFLQSPETTLHGGLHLKPFRQQSSLQSIWHVVAQCIRRITNRPPTKARMLCQDGGKGLPSPSDISNDGGRTASGALSCGQVPQDTSHWKRQLRLGVKLPKEQPTRQKGYQKHLDILD